MCALSPDALAHAELPLAAKKQLQEGIPRDVRLPGWLGPTLFSSEIGSGQLSKAASFAPAFEDHAFSKAFIIGSVREIQGPPSAYSVFCLQPRSGDLWLVDTGEPNMVRFVNSGLDEFLRSVRVFVDAWARAKSVPTADVPIVARHLHDELRGIDAHAFAIEDNYWPTWLETEFEYP
jgi:hypothetical protein